MRTFRKLAITAAAAAFGVSGLLAAAPSHADVVYDNLDCVHILHGSAMYSATFTQPKKKKDPAILQYAVAHVGFTVGWKQGKNTPTASCLGVTYTIHIKNYDGATFQPSTQTLDYQGFTADPNTATLTKVDDSEVEVTWNGDGATTDFSTNVTTGPQDPSNYFVAWVTTTFAGQPEVTTNQAVASYSGGGNTFLG